MISTLAPVIVMNSAAVARHGGCPEVWMGLAFIGIIPWGVAIQIIPNSRTGDRWIVIANVLLGIYLISIFPVSFWISK